MVTVHVPTNADLYAVRSFTINSGSTYPGATEITPVQALTAEIVALIKRLKITENKEEQIITLWNVIKIISLK